MTILVVSVVGSNPTSAEEVTLANVEALSFDPNSINDLILRALEAAGKSSSVSEASGGLRAWKSEVSVVLTSEDPIRPTLHLNAETIEQLARVDAAFDFDPYV